jgi:hypothetical protein|tara:strand:+ start:133 stop:411 length:279 start_codon:yes stop_codon:yes gene_type:complete
MKYWLGANTGAGFIKDKEQQVYKIIGYAGNIWVTNDSDEAVAWAARNNLTEKTRAQAVTIQETAIENNITVWNNISDADVKGQYRPSEGEIP